jgi:hypothetical protein
MNDIDNEKTDIDHGKATGRLWAGIMSHRKSRLSLIARVAQLRDAGNMDCDAFRQIIDPQGDARYARLRPVLLASFSNFALVARSRRTEKVSVCIGLQYSTEAVILILDR